ncbi:MAG: cytochrome c [Nitrospirales bacterium]
MIPQIMRRMGSVYRIYCLNCHGAKGPGNGPVGDSLTSRPADFTSENVQQKPENELLTIIRNGKSRISMPSWKRELSEQEIRNVLAYLGFFKSSSQWLEGNSENGPVSGE